MSFLDSRFHGNDEFELPATFYELVNPVEPMNLIGLKYCGGCNPVIDRAALVQEVKKMLPEEWKLITEGQGDPWERALLVCGCPVACADRAEVRGLAGQWILISGEMVDREMVPEEQMATVIVRKIKHRNS